MFFFKQYAHKYSLVNDDEERVEKEKVARLRFCLWPKGIAIVLSLVFTCMLGGICGYALGTRESFPKDVSSVLKLDKIRYSFRPNMSFAEEPSPYTNQLWDDMFPINGGFFLHSTLAPTRTTFSSFHQLHCVNGIRQAYWKFYNAALRGEKIIATELPMDMQSHHVQHCIDLLRQTLMCHADITTEVWDDRINGVDGFQAEHQCRSWEQLVQWTSAQQIKYKGQNATTA